VKKSWEDGGEVERMHWKRSATLLEKKIGLEKGRTESLIRESDEGRMKIRSPTHFTEKAIVNLKTAKKLWSEQEGPGGCMGERKDCFSQKVRKTIDERGEKEKRGIGAGDTRRFEEIEKGAEGDTASHHSTIGGI